MMNLLDPMIISLAVGIYGMNLSPYQAAKDLQGMTLHYLRLCLMRIKR
ncbi:Uncharacterised protein [Mycobacteroides abscessus subsp. massiliense]|nr:Uncharacterised protein [Mycobacteroides abscessus subsp. massiliense]